MHIDAPRIPLCNVTDSEWSSYNSTVILLCTALTYAIVVSSPKNLPDKSLTTLRFEIGAGMNDTPIQISAKYVIARQTINRRYDSMYYIMKYQLYFRYSLQMGPRDTKNSEL